MTDVRDEALAALQAQIDSRNSDEVQWGYDTLAVDRPFIPIGVIIRFPDGRGGYSRQSVSLELITDAPMLAGIMDHMEAVARGAAPTSHGVPT